MPLARLGLEGARRLHIAAGAVGTKACGAFRPAALAPGWVGLSGWAAKRRAELQPLGGARMMQRRSMAEKAISKIVDVEGGKIEEKKPEEVRPLSCDEEADFAVALSQ